MEDLYDFFISSPVLDRNNNYKSLYIGSGDGNLYSIDTETGDLIWKFKTGGVIHTTPAIYNNTVYIGSWDTYVYAVDAQTGKEKWKFKTGEHPEYHVLEGLQSSPSIHDGKVFFGSRDGYFYSLDAETGDLMWKYDVNSSWILSTAGIKDDRVYIGTSDSFLFIALDADTGKEHYRFKATGYVYSSPALVENTAYFGDFSGKMFALDLNSEGKVYEEYHTSSRKKRNDYLNNEGGFNTNDFTKDKDMSQYQSNVELMERMHALGPIVSSPVVKDGVIYFGSADGIFYAVNLKGEKQEK